MLNWLCPDEQNKRLLRDILKQRLIWASGASAIALVAVGRLAFTIGAQYGAQHERAAAMSEFGGQDWYTISQQLIGRPDNRQRLLRCHEDGNPKCMIWIVNPPQ